MKSMFHRIFWIVILMTLLASCGQPSNQLTPTSAPAVVPSNTPTTSVAVPSATAGGKATEAGPSAQPSATAAATSAPSGQGGPAATLNVMTHDSFAASEEVVKQFEQKNNVKLNFIKSGDAGAALNRAILSKDAPMA